MNFSTVFFVVLTIGIHNVFAAWEHERQNLSTCFKTFFDDANVCCPPWNIATKMEQDRVQENMYNANDYNDFMLSTGRALRFVLDNMASIKPFNAEVKQYVRINFFRKLADCINNNPALQNHQYDRVPFRGGLFVKFYKNTMKSNIGLQEALHMHRLDFPPDENVANSFERQNLLGNTGETSSSRIPTPVCSAVSPNFATPQYPTGTSWRGQSGPTPVSAFASQAPTTVNVPGYNQGSSSRVPPGPIRVNTLDQLMSSQNYRGYSSMGTARGYQQQGVETSSTNTTRRHHPYARTSSTLPTNPPGPLPISTVTRPNSNINSYYPRYSSMGTAGGYQQQGVGTSAPPQSWASSVSRPSASSSLPSNSDSLMLVEDENTGEMKMVPKSKNR